MPPPRIAAIAMANTRPGKARHTSEIRIITESAAPPKYPQHTPTTVPNTAITATRIKVEKILALAPLITLDSISLPYVSVPIGC